MSPAPILLRPRLLAKQPVSLALQGGGALGAYTWGALDALLASRRISIDQISGTSAGALNGAVLAGAFATASMARRNPNDAAREALEAFWRAVARPDELAPLGFAWEPITQALENSLGQWLWANRLASPYTTHAPGANPLREVIARHVDIEAIRSSHAPALYVTVTNVRTGLPRVIANADMSIAALAASACLPQLFQAEELDGEPYWDGGFSGNPTLWPLIRHGSAGDVILVQLAADTVEELPRDPAAITRRVGELMFNGRPGGRNAGDHRDPRGAAGRGAGSAASPFVSAAHAPHRAAGGARF